MKVRKRSTHSSTTRASLALLGVSASMAWSIAGAENHGNEVSFDVADLFFELNNTDGDLGIHGLIDGGPWTSVRILDSSERQMMGIRARGRLGLQGVTELFFESAEPTFDELAPEDFFDRFPEGEYDVEGFSLDGERLDSDTTITHLLPAPPAPTVNDTAAARVCDEDDPDYDAPTVGEPVTIAWPEITMSHPDLGRRNEAVEIVNYELVVEAEIEVGGEEFTMKMSMILPPNVRSVRVPEELLDLSDEFKYEVLAREASFNQTATESCFLTE